MAKKTFFTRRTPAEIENLNVEIVDTPVDLSYQIEGLNPETEAIILDGSKVQLTHPYFEGVSSDREYVSRMALRGIKRAKNKRSYPNYVGIQQPRSIEDAVNFYKKGKLPFRLRNKSLFDAMHDVPEKKNFNVGLMYFPITGNDKSPVMIPFWALCAGNMIDVYSQRVCKDLPWDAGSSVQRDYAPNFIVKVPSTSEGQGRYIIKWLDVPTGEQSKENKAVLGWNTRPTFGKTKEGVFESKDNFGPLYKFFQELSHEGKHRRGETFEFTLIDPHVVASWAELLRQKMREGDFAPWEMSQLPLISRDDAAYWNKLNNNLLILERNSKKEYVTKHPRIDQLSVLMARHIGNKIKKLKLGEVQETMFWDPDRDGKISKYPVLPGER